VGVSIALAASISGLAAAPAHAATPSALLAVDYGEHWIVFQQFLGRSTVTLARLDGSDLHSPTLDVPGGDQTNPDWSPDGMRLVFAVAGDERENLWVVNADGTDARILADCEGDCLYLDDPDWSPDGQTVLFSRMRSGDDGGAISTLEQVDVAGGTTSVIVQAEPGHFYAGQRWSPAGTSIVLEVVELSGVTMDSDVVDVSLAIIDLATPAPAGRELLGSGRFPETAAWAPDGSVIVFGALDAPGGNGLDLYAIEPDGSGLRQITTLAGKGGSATHPEVTADGTSVVFTATILSVGGPVLGQVDLDGGEVTSAMGEAFISGVHPRLRP
jgi:Tol biopolymer transport system component